MTGIEIMSVVRQRIADKDKLNITDADMLSNINTAIRYLAQVLISRKSPDMISSVDLCDFYPCPVGFHSFVGQFPCYREGNVLRTYDGGTVTGVRFFQATRRITALSDTIEIGDEYFDPIVMAAVALCGNKDEMDVSFETNLLTRIESMLPGVTS